MAVMALLYGTGLRRGELERLDVEDWKREEGLLLVDGRKTGRERSLPVAEGIWRCVEGYLPLRHNLLEKRGVPGEKALFINREGKRLSAQSLGLLVHRLARSAKVPLVSLHQFRHTCASDLLESGVSLPAVQQMLGHMSVSTTGRYLQIADPERARAMKKHPLNDYLGTAVADKSGPGLIEGLLAEKKTGRANSRPLAGQPEGLGVVAMPSTPDTGVGEGDRWAVTLAERRTA